MPVLSTAEAAANLAALMRNFDRDGIGCRRRIGELLDADLNAFRDAAVEVLKTPEDNRAVQFLISTLVPHGLLLPVLCHPALKREQVLSVARIAQRIDPQAEAIIAKSLADGLIGGDRCLQPKDAARLLDVLSETSDGTRILPSLLRLLRHPNPHLRSKAVKMIGRGSRSAKWVQGRLAEADPRVRANAIESLWGLDSPESRELLQSCVHDGDNRAAGNALVGLHRIGDSSVIPEFVRMASHESMRFRATAAWAMGESGDPRFSEALARLLRDENPPVRTRALAGLGRIKDALAKARLTTPWNLACMVHDNPQKNTRRLQLVVATTDGSEYPVVLGTQFLVTEDSQPVISYRATDHPASEALSVLFVFPRSGAPPSEPCVRGALSCRTWKRRADLWCLQPYLSTGASEGADDESPESPLRLMSSVDTIGTAFQQVPKRSQCPEFWNAILQAVLSDYGGIRGKRHVIVFTRSAISTPPPEELSPLVVTGSQVQVQVVSTVPNPIVEDFCRRVRGVFQIVESPDQIAGLIRTFYLNLLTRYEISYTPVSPGCRAVKVRVQTASGWGEASFPIASEALALWQVPEEQ